MRLQQYITEKFEWYRPKSNTTIKDIAERYYDEGDKASETGKTVSGDSYVIMSSVRELDKYKEYKWSNKNFRKKDIEPEYWDKLVNSIRKNGIRNPLTVILYKNERRAKIGEGNHRLGIAKELRISELPVRFEYWMGDKPKKKEKQDKEFDKILADFKKEQEEKEINKLLKQILGDI